MVDSMDYTDTLLESELKLQISEFPSSGNRDFTFVRSIEGGVVPLNSLELLKLDRAADLIQQNENQAEALNQALCRLLVPSLRTSHVGRHLVIEPWTESVVRGETLGEEARTELARKLSLEQADKYRVIQAGDCAIEDPIEQVFWGAVTDLPFLGRTFDDPELGKFGKALYFQIVPPGEGRCELEGGEPGAVVTHCIENSFADLKIGGSARERCRLFRKYMAVTVRWTSKLTGQLAQQLVDEMKPDELPLSPAEHTMLNLKYGAAECFGKINVGFLWKCEDLFEAFFNEIYRSVAEGRSLAEQHQVTTDLLRFVFLLGNYQRLRAYARLQEKQGQRDQYWDRIPGQEDGHRISLDDLLDAPLDREPGPFDQAVTSEARLLLLEQVLPELERTKPNQARVLRLYLKHDHDMESASDAAGLPPRNFRQQLLHSVLPSAARVARRLGIGDLFVD